MRIRAIQSACTQGGWRSGPISRTASVFIIVLFLSGGAAFAEEPVAKAYEIAAQSVSTALKVFATQSDMQLIFTESDVGDVRTAGIIGNMTPREALTAILKGTDLEFEFTENNVIVVRKPKGGTEALANSYFVSPGEGRPDQGNGRTAGTPQKPVMMTQVVAEQSQTSRTTETDSDKDEKRRPLEEIIVTGTNIRGITDNASPVVRIDRERIETSGFATVEQIIQSLPQNFNGGNSTPASSGASTNAAAGSSPNLRGAGAGGTLVLVNGRRIAPGAGGRFTDISIIPLSAIQSVEILTDGASAVYGSDAIAGVVNFVLRDDFEGAETRIRYGFDSKGDVQETIASQLAGFNWESGNIVASYEFTNRTELTASDRDYSNDVPQPQSLLPPTKEHSIFAFVNQDITSNIDLFGSAIHSIADREQQFSQIVSTDVRSTAASIDQQRTDISGGVGYEGFGDWRFEFSADYSDTALDRTETVSPPSAFDIGGFNQDYEIREFGIKGDGDLFELPAGDIRMAIGATRRTEDFVSLRSDGSTTVDLGRNTNSVFAEVLIPVIGESNAFPGFRSLEVNVAARYDDYNDFGQTTNPKYGVVWGLTSDFSLRSTYSTSFRAPPLVSFASSGREFVIADAFESPDDTGFIPVIRLAGTADLDAEEATNFTIGTVYEPSRADGLKLSLYYYEIDYSGRIGNAPLRRTALQEQEFYAPIVSQPSGVAEVQELIANAQANGTFFDVYPIFTGMDFDPALVEYILDFRQTNLNRLQVNGFDASISYHFEVGENQFDGGLSLSYVDEYLVSIGAGSIEENLVDEFQNPVDLTGRADLSWRRGSLSSNLALSYVDGYSDVTSGTAVPVDSWLTADLSLRYRFGDESSSGLKRNLSAALVATNIFDSDPPEFEGFTNQSPGYDSTNASPLGRFVAIELNKGF